MVSTRKGLSDVAIMTPESVDDLYHGITPALVPDFYGPKGAIRSTTSPVYRASVPKRRVRSLRSTVALTKSSRMPMRSRGKMGENLRAHTMTHY